MKVSLCMIVRDEEAVLARCLDSVAGLFDEIVIVDTGSTDRTREIALWYTDSVYDFAWVDNFSAARNFAVSKATGDYFIWLDADDIVEGENRGRLSDVLASLEKERPDVVMLPYNVAFDENGRVLLSYERERIIRAGAGMWFEGEVHEAISPRGKIIRGNAAVSHRKLHENVPGRNLRIFEKMLSDGKTLDPRMRYYYARELRAAGRLEKAAEWFSRCAEDPKAWSENRISACYELSECLLSMGRCEESDSALFAALKFGQPRADLCCEIGNRFLSKGDFASAGFWYRLAPEQFRSCRGGFVHADYGGYIPYMQLCVIYDRLGDKKTAEHYNSLAGEIKPQSPEYLQNKAYFESLKS